MEKEVSITSSGVCGATFPKTWESVISSRGFFANPSRASRSLSSLTTIAVALLSKISRMVCTWGKMSRPLGAAISMGTTSRQISPGSMRSPTIWASSKWAGARSIIRSFKNSIPSPLRELTATRDSPSCFSRLFWSTWP